MRYWKKREEPGYAEFRKAVIRRDKAKCQFPGCKKRTKIVHHIIRYADSGYLKHEPTNGICLCNHHHKEVTGKERHYVALFQSIVRDKS